MMGNGRRKVNEEREGEGRKANDGKRKLLKLK